MVTTILSDDVINTSQLRDQMRLWLEKAYIKPVSIMSGKKRLVLLNREHAKDMLLFNSYAKMIIQFCKELKSGVTKKSEVFPWIKYLSEDAISDFHIELLSTFVWVSDSNDWLILDELLDDWKATAEVESSPKLVRALSAKENPAEYVKLTS
jgi:hypothetical protein